MDSVQDWISSGKDYDAGVVLYNKLSKNKLLMRQFLRNSSIANQKKLEYELLKLLPVGDHPKPEPKIQSANQPLNVASIIETQIQETQKKQGLLLSELPPELRPELLKANQIWKENCLLKVQFNELPDEAENESMRIQLLIDANWKANALCWSKIDYWLEHKQLPKEAKKQFEGLTAPELVKRQQYHFQNISKISKRLKANRLLLKNTTSIKQIARLNRLIAKQESDLLTKNEELQILNRMINGQG